MMHLIFLILFSIPAAWGQGHASPAKYWLKMYPANAFSAHWTLTLVVRDPMGAKEVAAGILGRNGGKPHLPIAGMAGSRHWGQQQLSFSILQAGAEKALVELEKLGGVRKKDKNRIFFKDELSEARSKLGRLKAERVAGKATIDRFGSIAALTDELIEHLEGVVRAGDGAEGSVLFNIILEIGNK